MSQGTGPNIPVTKQRKVRLFPRVGGNERGLADRSTM